MKGKGYLYLILLLIFWSGVACAIETVQLQKKRIYLTVDIPQFENVGFVIGRVDPANRNVTGAEGYAQNRKLVKLIPRQPGRSSVVVYDQRLNPKIMFDITVMTQSQGALIGELRQLLGDIEGINFEPVGTKVSIGGHIILPKDYRRVLSVFNQIKNKDIIITARLSDLSMQLIAKRIMDNIGNNEKLKKYVDAVAVKVVGSKFELTGTVDTGDDKAKINLIVKEHIPEFIKPQIAEGFEIFEPIPEIVDLIDIREPKKETPKAPAMIKIIARYVELNKNYVKQFGIDWGPGIKDVSELEVSSEKLGIIGGITGTINSLIPKLKTATEMGMAREIQRFEILVNDKEEGSLNNVTKIPFPVIGEQGQEGTEFAETGLSAAIKPELIGSQPERTKLSLKFKLATLAGFVNRKPSVTENTLNTFVTLRPGQSAAIGGLVTANVGKEFNRLPKATGVTDPIFRFFRSKQFQDNKTQFVVFVTPYVMEDVHVNEQAEIIGQKFNIKLPKAPTPATGPSQPSAPAEGKNE
ncbi:MAG: hypothetical protein HYS98_04570 [Deltaproteobacteria bacterium]|nr:hypothetical protein [Deltaproteobacteria bacterium]